MQLTKPLSRSMRAILALGATVVLLAACAGDETPDPSPIELLITASPEVNPDHNDRPSPLLVRVYELRSAGTFETADFFALLEQDRAVLGDDLVNRWEFQLDPGETTRLDTSFEPDSGFVGVVAAFRDIEQARWRAITRIHSGETNELSARIGRLDVALEPR